MARCAASLPCCLQCLAQFAFLIPEKLLTQFDFSLTHNHFPLALHELLVKVHCSLFATVPVAEFDVIELELRLVSFQCVASVNQLALNLHLFLLQRVHICLELVPVGLDFLCHLLPHRVESINLRLHTSHLVLQLLENQDLRIVLLLVFFQQILLILELCEVPLLRCTPLAKLLQLLLSSLLGRRCFTHSILHCAQLPSFLLQPVSAR
mmetsp:Transcript_7097/g.16232  ORF Transcript_7097/g.16232 Transcript_7097/m.16232 type:complete len:208 (+) Transcript_7097:575-1198(+)